MQVQMGNHGRALELGKKAVGFFQKAGYIQGEMGVCNTLGEVERNLGHLDAAGAWYARALELAKKTKSRFAVAVIAQNVGILHQNRAEQADDPEDRDVHLRRAVSSTEEGLAIELEMENQVGAASSYQALGILYKHLEELDRAEEYLQHSLRIHESLNLPEVWKDYASLADVARARGDTKAADEWQAKCDAKLAELVRLRLGDAT